jgi:glycosyltransferase involved in cell wall biosynthesis
LTILFLAAASPWPPTSGARLRNLHLGRALAAAADVELTVLGPVPTGRAEPFALTSAGPPPPRLASLLASWRLPYQVARHSSRRLRQRVAGGGWDTVHASYAFTAPTALLAGAPVVLDAPDVEADVARGLADVERNPLRRLRWRWEAAKTLRFERSVVQRVAAVSAASEADADTLLRYGAPQVVVVPNGVDSSAIEYRPPARGATLAYVGSYDYWPNAAAALELVSDVLPRVRKVEPGAGVTVIGRRPPPGLRKAAAAAVTVTGEVDDVLTHLRPARALVVPLRAGSGTRLKVLEALAAGVPVVSTGLGVAGLGLVDGEHVLVGESPAELAAQAVRVIRDDALATALSDAGRRVVEARFAWEAVARPLVALHAQLARQ